MVRYPDVYRYEETRTREVNRAKYSPLKLFSKTKTETYTVPVTDDSEQRKWKSKKAQIEQEYQQQIANLRKQEADYEERKRRLTRGRIENVRKLEQVERRQAECVREIQHLEKLHKEIYEKNKREYFEIQKRDFIALVCTYIEDVVQHELEELLMKNIEMNIAKIKKSAKSYYIDSENKYRQKLQVLLKETNHDYDDRLERNIQQAIKEFSSMLDGLKVKETVQV